ncbi:MAG: glycosyltransferase family 87 protein, partial [Vicinamibacterales bacterium]
GPAPRASHRGPALLGLVLLVILISVARAVDVPRAGYGVKSDEATYVAMALSLAHDGNLSYERRDYERFTGIYHQGPEGIFLKRGRRLRLSVRPPFPFVHAIGRADPDASRLYYGKAFIYPVFAAPFVWLYGLNGMLLFHVLLLAAAALCGYLFLAAQSPPGVAALYTTAFLGAAALPVYGVFLMPEIFNFALVFVAFFLWLYKEVAPDTRLRGHSTDIVAAVLLGLATYSKPAPVAALVAPLVLLAWWRRRWGHGLAIGLVAVAVAGACFAITAAISGEFNYQGGERQAFYGRFPFDAPESTWAALRGNAAATDGTAARRVLTSPHALGWFANNVTYFLMGRHFGFIPYYFPGAVAVIAWLLSRQRRDPWRVLTFAAFALAAVALLLITPFTWSGGGGPPGNRYVISAYAVLFFLVPPTSTAVPGVLAWIGGALFTAKMLVTPFESAKFTWQITEKGPARRLPVELSMAQDLPVMLAQPLRGRVQYGRDPFLLLYFLDQNAFPPEPEGMWLSGAGRADIIVRAVDPIAYLSVEARSPIPTVLTLSMGAGRVTVPLAPGKPATFTVPADGVRDQFGHAYLLQAQSSEGFVPHVVNPASPDYRNLSAQLRFRPVSRRP